jgi:D-inositol-3-phosphate glycosyltransferase
MNRITLRFMYRIVDHIIVHTEMMKQQLAGRFGVPAAKVTVIEHGINSMVPRTDLTPKEARLRLGLPGDEKVMLFFGNITPYKGLEYLCAALARLRETDRNLKLIIAGRITNRENAAYWETIEAFISESELEGALLRRTEFVPDDEIEIYFKAADVLILPYRRIFQSGVLFLSYAFGLPVIAADVGSLRGDIVEGETGFLSRPEDAADLARTIDGYFKSDLYKDLDCRRDEIVDYANRKYSWRTIGAKTKAVYDGLSRA